MSETTELLPCPFCGGEYAQVRYMGGKWQELSAFNNGYRGECCDCGAITAACDTEAEAAEAWNRRAAVTDHDFAMAVHDGNLWSKCSECKERQGHYMDAETIQSQQEHIAELQVENAKLWRMNENIGAELANFGEQRDKAVAERDELIRDMWREITTCPDYPIPPCMTRNICDRIREFGIEVDDDER